MDIGEEDEREFEVMPIREPAREPAREPVQEPVPAVPDKEMEPA